MFHFSLKIENAAIYTDRTLMQLGIYEDIEFKKRVWDNFYRSHPLYDPTLEESDGFKVAHQLSEEVFFCNTEQEPCSALEAAEIVRSLFFTRPVRLWLNKNGKNSLKIRIIDKKREREK